jgi:hypothetical protein
MTDNGHHRRIRHNFEKGMFWIFFFSAMFSTLECRYIQVDKKYGHS